MPVLAPAGTISVLRCLSRQKLEKTVDNPAVRVYNIPCQQAGARRCCRIIMGICIVVVRQTLTLFVGVRFSHPQPNRSLTAAVFSGHSAAGSAPGSGLGGRGFKSRCSDQKTSAWNKRSSFFVFAPSAKSWRRRRSFWQKARKCSAGPGLPLQSRRVVLQFKTLSLRHFSTVEG